MLGSISQTREMLINSQEGGRGVPTGIAHIPHPLNPQQQGYWVEKKKKKWNLYLGKEFMVLSVLNMITF